jgi:hypothetical protein
LFFDGRTSLTICKMCSKDFWNVFNLKKFPLVCSRHRMFGCWVRQSRQKPLLKWLPHVVLHTMKYFGDNAFISHNESHKQCLHTGSRCGSAVKWWTWENKWNIEALGLLPTPSNLFKKTNNEYILSLHNYKTALHAR